ncbi:MAG: glycosyltransferase family 1 protein, partial [Chloroflexi bacterium]|nr:glycosyltransferase family 1 protein [Chloroflexota bacterium]
ELVKLYNRALLTVYAPVMEPFGLVAVESMACGTPVLGVREAGLRETIVDGIAGVLVDRDPVAFAQALCALLRDPLHRQQMGAAASAYVRERWTWAQTDARLEQVLQQVADL